MVGVFGYTLLDQDSGKHCCITKQLNVSEGEQEPEDVCNIDPHQESEEHGCCGDDCDCNCCAHASPSAPGTVNFTHIFVTGNSNTQDASAKIFRYRGVINHDYNLDLIQPPNV